MLKFLFDLARYVVCALLVYESIVLLRTFSVKPYKFLRVAVIGLILGAIICILVPFYQYC